VYHGIIMETAMAFCWEVCRHASEIWSIGPTKAYQAIGEAGSVRSIWFVVERSRPTVEIRDEDCLVQKC
jgi:hypothetical protein